jgi:DNA mismatch repair protein MutS
LNELEEKFPRIKNFNVATKEIGQKVIFLRKLKAGGSQHSFGIHVAKMAGMPRTIVERAANILTQLETKSIDNNTISEKVKQIEQQPAFQLSIFDTVDETAGKIKSELLDIDVNRMTPIECMMKLSELVKIVKEND